MRLFTDQRGVATSLIEALMVIFVTTILAGMALLLGSSEIEDANFANAQSTVKLIGASVLEFIEDTGFPPAFQSGLQRNSSSEIYLVLESDGADADDIRGRWQSGVHDLLDNHLIRNSPGHRDGRSDLATVVPYPKMGALKDRFGDPVSRTRGWNGPYATYAFHADPWGDKYLANVGLLTAKGRETATTLLGLPQGVRPAVFALSAGPNRSIETEIVQPSDAFVVGGDDIVFRIQ